MKKNDVLWVFSLIVIGIITVIFLVVDAKGIELSQTAMLALGICEILALMAVAITTVKKVKGTKPKDNLK